MKIKNSFFRSAAMALFCFAAIAACNKESDSKPATDDTVADNIKKYSTVWDGIINDGNLALFNAANFSADVVFHSKPADIVGIDSARAYYANCLTGFSHIKFDIVNIFGQGDQLTKHRVFTGTHTGNFFGIPPTGKTVTVEGFTIARMQNGIIVEEQDFFDNLDLLTQLGLYP